MIRLALATALTTALMAGCSGSGPSTAANAPATGNESSDVQIARHDPAAFIQRFDKDGNGTVEIAELPERMQKWVGKVDTNNDGKISAEEMKAHVEARQATRFARADKDGNGSLNAAEVGEKRWNKIRVADANSDGNVTRQELESARAEGKIHGKHDHKEFGKDRAAFSPEALVQRFDKNGNGTLEASEVPERAWTHIHAADANGDGSVTKDELEKARAERKDAR